LKKEVRDLEEYKSNSNKSRDGEIEQIPEKRIEPVISGTAVTQKKTGFGKFAESMIAEDVSNVGSFILTDVLIPAFKKTIVDIVTNGIDMLMYGKTSSKSNSGLSRLTYSGSGNYYNYARASEPVKTSVSTFDYDNIIFENRGDAEAVLESMDEAIDVYGVVSVGDLYELANLPSPNYTVNKYGWTNIRSAQVIRVRDGYMLKMPKAMPIN
jgi:hypothetical protein